MADFMADLNSGIDAWIPELFKRVQRDFQIDTNAQLEDVSVSYFKDMYRSLRNFNLYVLVLL